MSCFISLVIMEMLGYYKWCVYELFRFYFSEDKNDVIEVLVGFVIDFVIVLCIFWLLLLLDGEYVKVVIIYDYLYYYLLCNRKEFDFIFLDGMKVLGVLKWKRIIMYLVVRIFGWKYYYFYII